MAKTKISFSEFVPVLALSSIGLLSGTAQASGLAVPAQSASGAAVAVAGVAAGVDDASTVFYNAAGMTRLTSSQATLALGISQAALKVSNTRGSDVLGSPMRGTAESRDTTNYIPSLYAVFVASDNLRLGIGISTPYGQSIAYDSQWLGRYLVQEASLQDSAVSFSAAYRATDILSFGGGLEYHQASVKRISAVDFGAACLDALGLGPCGFLGILPQQADGRSHLEVSGHGTGYNLGMTADFGNGWRTGLAFRSSVKLDLDGDLRFDVPASAAVLNGTGAFNSTKAHSRITLPESLHWGLSWDVDQRTRLLFGASWTRWSRLSALGVSFDNPLQPASNEALNWRDAWRYSIGATHAVRPDLTLSAGLAYQQSPVSSAHASPLFPIGAASELVVGLNWKITPRSELAFSYGYQKQQTLHYSVTNAASGTLTGDIRQELQAVGLQFNQKF